MTFRRYGEQWLMMDIMLVCYHQISLFSLVFNGIIALRIEDLHNTILGFPSDL